MKEKWSDMKFKFKDQVTVVTGFYEGEVGMIAAEEMQVSWDDEDQDLQKYKVWINTPHGMVETWEWETNLKKVEGSVNGG